MNEKFQYRTRPPSAVLKNLFFFCCFFFLRLPIELEALKIPPETNEKPLIMPGIFKVFSVRMSCCS